MPISSFYAGFVDELMKVALQIGADPGKSVGPLEQYRPDLAKFAPRTWGERIKGTLTLEGMRRALRRGHVAQLLADQRQMAYNLGRETLALEKDVPRKPDKPTGLPLFRAQARKETGRAATEGVPTPRWGSRPPRFGGDKRSKQPSLADFFI